MTTTDIGKRMCVLPRIPELACPQCKGELREAAHHLECRACDIRYRIQDGIPRMFAGDTADLAEEIAVQDRVADDYALKRYRDPVAREYHEWWTDQMLARVRSDGRILDSGCGIGGLFDRVPAERVVGLDISSRMLRYAAERSDQLVLGNSQELPFRDQVFDTVFCRSLLHHLPRPELAVKEMFRVLRPDGEVGLIDTNRSLLSSLPRRWAYRGKHFAEGHGNLDRRIIEGLLTPYFRVEEVFHFGYLAYPLLGFPDLMPIMKYVPARRLVARALTSIDAVISRIPLIRAQSWAILVKRVRREHAAPEPP